MLNQPTLEKLHALRLHGMAEALRAQMNPAQRDGIGKLSFEERFAPASSRLANYGSYRTKVLSSFRYSHKTDVT
jgi:hypothetical protein